MKIIENKKIFFMISGAMVGLSALFVLMWGLVFGIDFTGGSITEVSYAERPEKVTDEYGYSVAAVKEGLNHGRHGV